MVESIQLYVVSQTNFFVIINWLICTIDKEIKLKLIAMIH